MQTVFSMLDREIAFVSTDDRCWITKIRKAMRKEPDAVQVIAQPQNNDGCWYGKIPAKWIRVNPPRRMTEEQIQRARQNARERFGVDKDNQDEDEEDIEDEQ